MKPHNPLLFTTRMLPAILIVACGSGSDGPSQPGGAANSTNVTHLTASVTTAAATATPTAVPMISAAEANQIRANVKGLIAAGLLESGLRLGSQESEVKISQVPFGDLTYLDPDYMAKLIDICDASIYGTPITLPDFTIPNNYNGPDTHIPGRTVQPGDGNYSGGILGPCEDTARAAKALFNATGDAKFKEASEAWKPLHHQMVEEVRQKDPRIDETYWQAILSIDYDLSFEFKHPQ